MSSLKPTSTTKHIPVLLHEAIKALNLRPGQTFLDGTFGGGGHSREVLQHFPNVRIIALDQDPKALAQFGQEMNIVSKVGNFRDLDQILQELGLIQVEAILFDLGLSTDQLEDSNRGFSFRRDEPLDMRASGQGLTAADILNTWDEHTIELILRGFGEETFSRKIAEQIVIRRKVKSFQTTNDLVEVILSVKSPGQYHKIHPATKTFQALRIATNEELTNLEIGLEKGFKALGPKGRFVVISFHSLEDRIVKNFFRDQLNRATARLVNQSRKPITPSGAEIKINPRARSAKLRVIEKI